MYCDSLLIRSLRRFMWGQQGSSVAEHATVMALIAGVGIIGYVNIAPSIEGAFLNATQIWNGASVSTVAVASPRAATKAAAGVAVSEATTFATDGLTYVGTAAASAITSAAFAGVFLRRRHRARGTISPALLPESTASQFVAKRQAILQNLSCDLERLMTNQVCVRHLMTTHLTTVETTARVRELREIMQTQQVRHLLVVDEFRRLLGVISDRDLGRYRNRTAEAVMSRRLQTCQADTPLTQAVTMLLESRISSLPVLDGEQLVGIITATDVVMGLQCSLQLIDRIIGRVDATHSTAGPSTA